MYRGELVQFVVVGGMNEIELEPEIQYVFQQNRERNKSQQVSTPREMNA